MTALPHTPTLPLSARLSRGLAVFIRPMRRSAAVAELATLDDRLLRDIGLTRIDVDAMRRMW